MPDPLAHAEESRNWIERLKSHIPGFAGYQEKETRRDADKILREWLASKLDVNKKVVNALVTAWTNAGRLDALKGFEMLRNKLDKAVARIRFADYGYGSFFGVNKIKEAELEQMYRFDLSLIERVEGFASTLASIPEPGPDVSPTDRVNGCVALLDEFDVHFNDREHIVKGIQ
jgi:hypothetical protein